MRLLPHVIIEHFISEHKDLHRFFSVQNLARSTLQLIIHPIRSDGLYNRRDRVKNSLFVWDKTKNIYLSTRWILLSLFSCSPDSRRQMRNLSRYGYSWVISCEIKYVETCIFLRDEIIKYVLYIYFGAIRCFAVCIRRSGLMKRWQLFVSLITAIMSDPQFSCL